MAAMDVVEKYYAQLTTSISTVEKTSGATVRDFVRDVEISTRLRNALNVFIESGGEREIGLEELDKDTFQNIRNVGRSSWREFSSKRDEYMRERLS